MSTVTDLQLINKIKEKNDSDAVVELVNRHTGIYMNTIRAYSVYPDFTNRVNVSDLKDDKTINIYQWALSYDPNRGMKFGSYVGNMTKFMCQNIIYHGKESKEIDENTVPTNDTEVEEQVSRDMAIEEINTEVMSCGDEKFKAIFKLRHGEHPMSWREIGKVLNMTYEGARKIYNKHIGSIKEHATT